MDGIPTTEGVEMPPVAETPEQVDTIIVGDYEIPLRNIVETILQNVDVVRFGEENWTFSVALAAIQGGWRGIVSTAKFTYGCPPNPEWLAPTFANAQRQCEEYCKTNGENLNKGKLEIESNIAIVKSVQQPIRQKWLLEILPTNTHLTLEGKVAWYQCPWEGRDSTASHIIDFLKHMGEKQRSGDYVFIGITTWPFYVHCYNLGCLPGFTKHGASIMCPWYDLVGADNMFIYKLLRFGYHHQGKLDIHEKIFNDHVTLIFKRNGLRDP